MMKKNFIKAAFVAAFASIAGYSVYTSQQKVEMSDLAMANVEALANDEDGNGNVMYHCNGSGTCSYELGTALPGRKAKIQSKVCLKIEL